MILNTFKWMLWGKKTPRRFVFGVGAFTIGSYFFDMFKAPVMHNLREPLALQSRYGADNYAVVAGATGPTGEAFCQKLTSQGFKLILVDDSANSAALAQLSAQYGSAPVFTFDFRNQTTWQEYQKLCDDIQAAAGGEAKKNNIAVLVNNIERLDAGKGKIDK